jgi:hypothetical protein
VSSVDLRDTVEAIRTRRRYNAKSEAFLDELFARADQHDVVFISYRRWRWLTDLAQRAGVRNGGKHA